VWIITAWQCISPEVSVKGIKECCVSIAADETDDGMLWKGIEEDGNVRSVCVRKMKALTMKMETETLIGKDR